MELDKIKELVLFMKKEGVVKFKVDNFEVEFNLLNSSELPQTIDTSEDKKEALKKNLKSLLEQENDDLMWSA